MAIMNLEFPMLTIASQLNRNLNLEGNPSCEDIYTKNFGMDAANATALCSSTGNFTFSSTNYFPSCVALTTVYLYQDGYNAYYYDEFVKLTGITPDQMSAYLYGDK
jgi:hypothetical protein